MTTTSDLSKFGFREIKMVRDLLNAWIEQVVIAYRAIISYAPFCQMELTMPRPTIEYLNRRQNCKAASGGTNYAVESDAERKARIYDEQCRDEQQHPLDLAIQSAQSAIMSFSLWAETSRQALVEKLGIPQDFAIEETF